MCVGGTPILRPTPESWHGGPPSTSNNERQIGPCSMNPNWRNKSLTGAACASPYVLTSRCGGCSPLPWCGFFAFRPAKELREAVQPDQPSDRLLSADVADTRMREDQRLSASGSLARRGMLRHSLIAPDVIHVVRAGRQRGS
jgi:hypothetical protein